jgi:hypothetical protein
MPKFQVQIIESDSFGWNRRLEDTVIFQNEVAAKAFQDKYNKEPGEPDVEGNIMIATKPLEIQEEKDASVKSVS